MFFCDKDVKTGNAVRPLSREMNGTATCIDCFGLGYTYRENSDTALAELVGEILLNVGVKADRKSKMTGKSCDFRSFLNGMCYRSCHFIIFTPIFSVTSE